MPRPSQKKIQLEETEGLALLEVLHQCVFHKPLLGSNQNDIMLQFLLLILKHGPAMRYLTPCTNLPKIEGGLELYLSDGYPEDRFRSMFRMNKYPFFQLAHLIQDHQVFQNNGPSNQVPPATQLAVALSRLGRSDQSTVRSSTLLGIGDGTVHVYLWRVIKAIMLTLYQEHVFWPTGRDMRKVQRAIEKGTEGRFRGCCGFIDGVVSQNRLYLCPHKRR